MNNNRNSFLCPKCGHPQTCPCPHCQERHPTEKPWVWLEGDLIKCGNCGLLKSANWWEEQAIKLYNEKEG